MFPLTLFEALLMTHFVMDWLFQTKWEATNKSKQWLPLFIHCFIYTVGFLPVFWWYKINFIWLGIIFVSHFILDRRVLERWWLEKIKGFKFGRELTAFEWILLIGLDQTFHLVVLAAVTLSPGF